MSGPLPLRSVLARCAAATAFCLAAWPALAAGAQPGVFDPAGPQADVLARLLWGFIIFLAIIWVAVMLVLLIAVGRRRHTAPLDPMGYGPDRDHPAYMIVIVLALATGVSVLVLTGFSYAAQKHLFDRPEGDVVIKLTGHQWWWEANYENPDPSRIVMTANELVVPVGEPISLKLEASDVIHSFWIPALMGKQDLIPGRQNLLRFTVSRPGVYRGQCAEFCGAQHAHMALVVIARPREEFDAWRSAQIASAKAPDSDLLKKGEGVFLGKACVSCHTVRGTDAGGRVGPDLTHLASRTSIAAGTLPMSRGTLAAWVADPQGIKPGTRMPPVALEPDELDALAAFLESLK